MAVNTNFTVSDPAWTKLRDIPEHKHRQKAYQQFTGYRYVKVEPPPPSAKGLASWLTSFMFKQRSPHHLAVPPYSIIPESFEDVREWALQDYEAYGFPGQPLNLTMDNLSTIYSRRFPSYTTWNDGSDTHTHGILLTDQQEMYKLTYDIVNYWHISLPGGYFPKTLPEHFSAFLNAIGMGYLIHPLFNPEPASISSNVYYTQLDARVAHAKEVAEKHKAKEEKHVSKRILCRNQFEQGDGEWLRCKEVAEYVLDFASQKTYLCKHCIVLRTQHLPIEMYTTYTIEEFMFRSATPAKKIKLVPLIGPAIPRNTPTISNDTIPLQPVDPSKVVYGKPIAGVPREHTEEERLILKDFQNKAKQQMIEGVANSLADQAFAEKLRLEQVKADRAKLNKDSHKTDE